MSNKTINTEQGHWVLANMGKKVLRPGGKELSFRLIDGLKITGSDDVVEFAPGMGFTASFLIKKNPKSYSGIELNEEAAERLQKKFNGNNRHIINASAAKTGLKDGGCDKLIGEAMLTMQAEHRKAEIIGEAFRILKPGGLYGIHELGLEPDNLDPKIKKAIQKDLATAIHVNARPMTKSEWTALLEGQGFKVKAVYAAPMHILEPERLINDEGIFGALRFGFNVATHPDARKKIMTIRKTFRKYREHLVAYGFILEKQNTVNPNLN